MKIIGVEVPVVNNTEIPINTSENIIREETRAIGSIIINRSSDTNRFNRAQVKLNRVINLVHGKFESSINNITELKKTNDMASFTQLNNIGITLR